MKPILASVFIPAVKLQAHDHQASAIAVSSLQEALRQAGICLDRAGALVKQAQVTHLADCQGASCMCALTNTNHWTLAPLL